MSELPDGIPPAEVAAPRASASGIVLREATAATRRVLLGVRSRRARFMPGHLAFPGGAVEAADGAGETRWVRCVAREIAEETGLAIAPERWIAVGRRVTPPLYPRRFDNAFFVVALERDPEPLAPATDEIESLRLAPPADVLEEWRAGRAAVPPPLLPLLRALAGSGACELPELVERLTRANALEERAPRIEFVPDVWMLPVRSATLPPATHTNVWIPGGRRFVVVDPGSTEPLERQRLAAVIERRVAAGGVVEAVLLTHHHRDHVGGAVALAETLGVPLRAHADVLAALPPSPAVGAPLADGARLDLDGLELRALHTPGHAPGHLAFHVPRRDALIAGDLLSGISTILIDPDHGDMGSYLASLRRVRELGCRLLLPGHGPPLPGRALTRLIAHREQREQRIVEQLAAGGSELSSIARAAYADVPQMPPTLTERQTLSHLLHLERQGRVRRAAAHRWRPA